MIALMSLSILSVMASSGLPKCAASRCSKRFTAFTLQSVFPKMSNQLLSASISSHGPCLHHGSEQPRPDATNNLKGANLGRCNSKNCRRERLIQSHIARWAIFKFGCASQSSTVPTPSTNRWHALDGLSDDFVQVAKPLQTRWAHLDRISVSAGANKLAMPFQHKTNQQCPGPSFAGSQLHHNYEATANHPLTFITGPNKCSCRVCTSKKY